VKRRLVVDAAAIGAPIDDVAASGLITYLELLRDRAIPLGLVAASDADRLYERHLLDCLRAVREFAPGDRGAVDLGSGAGLPGVVLATVLPATSFVLLDARRRSAGFLELVADHLGLANVEVVLARAEDLDVTVDVVTARAFGPVDRSWAAAHPLLRPGGRLIYFAGRGLRDRARQARSPEPPSEVRTTTVIASSAPLVIMSRRG
jgi:16S rRNA (guanine527-N7)-methyltransferase